MDAEGMWGGEGGVEKRERDGRRGGLGGGGGGMAAGRGKGDRARCQGGAAYEEWSAV